MFHGWKKRRSSRLWRAHDLRGGISRTHLGPIWAPNLHGLLNKLPVHGKFVIACLLPEKVRRVSVPSTPPRVSR
jgi:hypothetical protein